MEVSEKPVFSCFFFKFELFGPSELIGTHFHDLASLTSDGQLMSFGGVLSKSRSKEVK